MKKKYIILICFILVLSAGIIGFYLLTRPTILGNMSNEYSKQVTTTSDISFAGEAGNRIKFVFESDIISGNLDMTLYDSDGTAVYALDNAKELVTYFILERSTTYTLVAKCDNFVGTYKIFVYLDKINTSTDSGLSVQ